MLAHVLTGLASGWDAGNVTMQNGSPVTDIKHEQLNQQLSGDNLFSTLKLSQKFANSDLRHLQHSLDSDCLPVPEMLWSTSYSKPLPAVPNTTACSFHSNPSPDTPSEGCSKASTSSEGNLETSSDSTPSDMNSAPTFLFWNPGKDCGV